MTPLAVFSVQKVQCRTIERRSQKALVVTAGSPGGHTGCGESDATASRCLQTGLENGEDAARPG